METTEIIASVKGWSVPSRSLLQMLTASAYASIQILKNDVRHPNPRAVNLAASVPNE